jgi:hypothetical protein
LSERAKVFVTILNERLLPFGSLFDGIQEGDGGQFVVPKAEHRVNSLDAEFMAQLRASGDGNKTAGRDNSMSRPIGLDPNVLKQIDYG